MDTTQPTSPNKLHRTEEGKAMPIERRHLPLYYHRHLETAMNGQKACSDLARLYRVVLASTEIQQGISGHNASWQGTVVNT